MKKNIHKTILASRFDSNFSDYDISFSKHMSGYFIVMKKNTHNFELIGEDAGELVFKDCTKTIDEIKQHIKNKELNEKIKAEIFTKEHAEQVNFIENSSNENVLDEQNFTKNENLLDEQTFTEIQPKNLAKKKLINKTLPNTAQKAFEITENIKAFEIIEKENIKAFEIIEDKENSNKISNDLDEKEKIYFAKDIYLMQNKIEKIELIISGYDELCDSFYFDSKNFSFEYKYSIKKDELKALFITNLTSAQAEKFIKTFSFKTSRQTPKNIEIFINNTSIFLATLFA